LCPPHCPCVCHQRRPGMVLVWVHVLVLTPPPANPPPPGGRASKSRRSPRSKKPPDLPPPANGHTEGGVVLTAYRSTVEPPPPRPGPSMPKPPRRSKGGSPASLEGDGLPPAVPPKAPIKPPRSTLGPLPFSRRGSLQHLLEGRKLLLIPVSPLTEPLYQTYRQAVISMEIKRQTVPRNSSFSSSDCGAPSPGEGPPGPRGPIPHSTLWQELPAVRQSGLLGQISPEERKMQESLFEVVTSEASYLRSLSLLIEHFLESRELAGTVLLREHRILFSNIRKVKEVSQRFLQDLEVRLAESLQIEDVCDIVEEHAQHSFHVYIDYVRNQVYQEKTYSCLMEKNPHFATVVTRLQELPQCQRLPFMSFLLLPFQRITRIKMLLEVENVVSGSSLIGSIIEECNSEVGRMRHMEELIHIASKIEFDKLKAVPVISQSRQLLKQGELFEVVHRGTLFGTKPKLVPIYLFLFSDLLLITQRKSSERFVVLDYAHRSLVQAQGGVEAPAGAVAENSFYLTLLENHQGRSLDRLCRALILLPSPVPGWYEGVRLADGRKGWFPSRYVQEITNEHVRRRNLRERYRLLQAARQLQLTRTAKGKCSSA
uniref:Rho guanine nucleotide exchange factor 15 n=1 Tax=Sphenodon punctatus TaxID=8508 RepID=A0A8D0HUX0_SPHPU